jgi:SAM-dependent methyltransferase
MLDDAGSGLAAEDEGHRGPPPSVPVSSRNVRQVVGELAGATWTLAALALALETGLLDEIGEPATSPAIARRIDLPAPLVKAVLDVLGTIGFVRQEGPAYLAEPGLASSLEGPSRDLIKAEIRSNLLQPLHLFETARRRNIRLGWCHEDREILQAQGTRSRAVVEAYISHVFPQLPGLVKTLQGPRPTFLDVGSGVAEIAIEMCRRFPTLQAVGLDPLEPAMALAELNVRGAGLEDRIDLRRGRVEDLDEDAFFDLAQVPILFLTEDALTKGLAGLHKALRPGGWVVLQVLGLPGTELPPVLRLMCVLCGSEGYSPEHAANMLEDAGYEEVAIFPPLPGTPVSYATGRRAART